jgi:Na+/H+ antiporter NhaD/arsenite permease-like protein
MSPESISYLFSGFLLAMVVTLALEEKIHAKKSMIVGLFAVVCLFVAARLGIMPKDHATLHLPHHETVSVHMPIYIPGVEWEVIAIILGSGLFIDVVSRSGIFTWTAILLTKRSLGDPLKLLIYYSAITVIFSALLNNVAAMMIVGSLTMVSLDKLERKDLLLGFLLTEGLLTNIGGLLTLISSVPNIILGNMAEIGYVDFFIRAAPYTVVATALTIFMAVKLFGIRKLETEEERAAAAELVATFDENDGIESRPFFNFSWALLGVFILVIATTSVIPDLAKLGMGYVAVSFALIALIRYKHEVDKSYAAVDWDLLAFFTFLFVVIDTMKYSGVLDLIGGGIAKLLALPESVAGASLLWSSSIASSVTDNVPLAAVMGNILQKLENTPDFQWWATIFGTNLGGNFTPIGSASTVVAVAIIHRAKLPLSFGGFVKKASPFAVAQLTLATGYVLIFLR